MEVRFVNILRGVLAVATLATLFVPAVAFARPNVVVVMTDDQTEAQMRPLRDTRQILGKGGASFRNYSAAFPSCCPNRASLLTGQYAHNHGIRSNPGYEDFKPREGNALPVWLHRAGYHTALMGKYLNGYGPATAGEVPPGWDYWRGLTGTGYNSWGISENGAQRDHSGYLTDYLAREARRYVERQAPQGPFFLYVTPWAPHLAGTRVAIPAKRHRGRYEGQKAPRVPSFNEKDVSDKPSAVRSHPRLTIRKIDQLDRRWRKALESLLAVDDLVEGIVRKLRDARELGDTLIVFTSDNGFIYGQHRLPCCKNLPYRAAAELPLLMRGPGIPHGVKRGEAVSTVDLTSTILDVAGVQSGVAADGESLLPFARGSGGERGKVLIESRAADAVRGERWYYAEWPSGERELYDLRHDPHQLRNRARGRRYAARVKQLDAELDRLRGCAGETC